MMTDALIKAGKDQNVMRTRVLLRPILLLRFRCSILILLIKTVRCGIVRFSILHCVCVYIYIYIYIYIYKYRGCPRRNVPDFGRVFLMLKYTDITQNTYVQS